MNGLSDDYRRKFKTWGLESQTIDQLDELVCDWSSKGASVRSPSGADRAKRLDEVVAAAEKLRAALRALERFDSFLLSAGWLPPPGLLHGDLLEELAKHADRVAEPLRGGRGRPSTAEAARHLVHEIADIVGEDLPYLRTGISHLAPHESMRRVLGDVHYKDVLVAFAQKDEECRANFKAIVEGVFDCAVMDDGRKGHRKPDDALKQFFGV